MYPIAELPGTIEARLIIMSSKAVKKIVCAQETKARSVIYWGKRRQSLRENFILHRSSKC